MESENHHARNLAHVRQNQLLSIVRSGSTRTFAATSANQGRKDAVMTPPTATNIPPNNCPITSLADPRLDVVDATGKHRPDVIKLLATAFTDVVCDHHSDEGGHLAVFCQLLYGYAHTEVLVAPDGDRAHDILLAPPYPDLPATPGRSVGMVRRELGLSFEDLQREWRLARRRHGTMRALPDEWLLKCVPAELWKVAATLVLDGPSTAKTRIENYLEDFAERMLPADVSKPQGHPSDSAIADRVSAARRFMRILKALWYDGRRHDLLEPWALMSPASPDVKWNIPSGQSHVRNTRAVPGHIVRQVFSDLNAEIGRRLGVPAGDYEAEIEAIGEMTTRTGFATKGLQTPYVKRQALLVSALLGTRLGATTRLCEKDLVFDHELPDGTVQPAVKVHEWKTKDRTFSVWKPIPHAAATALRAHLVFMHGWLTVYKGVDVPADGSGPLIYNVLSRRHRRDSISRMFGGSRGRDDRGSAPAKLTGVRRRPGWSPLAGAGSARGANGIPALLRKEGRGPHVGHSAHPVRSCVRQWVDSLEGRAWLTRRRIDQPASWVAEALLGHEDGDLKKLYGGGSKPEDVEVLSGLGTQITWLMLTTDMGARKIYDEDAYRETIENIRALEAERRSIETQLDAVPERRARLRQQHGAAEDAGNAEKRRDFKRQLDALEDETYMLGRKSTRLEKQLGELRAARKDLRLDPRALKLIGDPVTAAEYEKLRNSEDRLDDIEAEVYGGLPRHQRRRLRRQRSYLSLGELAHLDGRSESFFKGLSNGNWPVKVRGIEPWARDTNPFTPWSSEKRRGVLVDCLNPDLSLFTDPDRRLRMEELLAMPYPEAWGADWESQALPKRRRTRAS